MFTTPSSAREERAGNLAHAQLPVVQPHDFAPVHPSEGGIVERPTTEQSHGGLARNFGSRRTLSTHGHWGAEISAQDPRASRPGGRWAHPPSTGGDLTSSRVRSTHPFHTKSPFSRFFGCRRQKNKNIVVSARGRRTPQAPTLRVLGCANARKYDYKSSSLYAQSIGLAAATSEPVRIACGTGAERVRNVCGTPADLRQGAI